MSYKKRNIEHKINMLLNIFPVVVIIGPRQCGKTSLSRKVRPDWKYIDLEKSSIYDQVSADVGFFFKENYQNLIIDEAQIFPDIFNEIRGVIDSDRKKNGRFIITGSSSPELLKKTSDSLAGRVGIVELTTFKANEVFGKPMSLFYDIINGKISKTQINEFKKLKPICTHSQIKEHFHKGGYPDAILSASQFEFEQWMENYFATYIERDIRSLFPKLDSIKFRRFVGILSGVSGQIINKSHIARAIEVDDKTVKDYLDIANGTFVWRMINSYEKSKVKTVIKMPKGGYRDSGLLHYLKKIRTLEDLEISPSIGLDFEHYVSEEIIKGIQSSEISNWDYFYYRTRAGSEIDLILEGPFGVLPIEIKYGTKIQSRGLVSLSKFLLDQNLPLGIVVNNADEVVMLKENIIQIPISYL